MAVQKKKKVLFQINFDSDVTTAELKEKKKSSQSVFVLYIGY